VVLSVKSPFSLDKTDSDEPSIKIVACSKGASPSKILPLS
jgi:hypothetical protein